MKTSTAKSGSEMVLAHERRHLPLGRAFVADQIVAHHHLKVVAKL